MKSITVSLAEWGQDHLFRRVLRNSSYLIISNIVSALISLATARLLGVSDFGALGVITVFVSNINRLLSFRMSDVVVRYFGEYVARKEFDRAAALVKAAGLTEGVTSIAAYLILAILAPLGARYLVKDPQTTYLFLIFGVSILCNLTTETATGVLQVGNHYRSQAVINLIQTFLVAGVIVAAYIFHGGLFMTVLAYLIGKAVLGLGPIIVAVVQLRKMLGPGWWNAPLSLLPPRKELVQFAVSTNLSGTVNMLARDNDQLWVSLFFSTTEAAYYKVAMILINLVVTPITPFINAVYPEINKTVVKRQWDQLIQLLKRVTGVAGAWTGAVALGLLLFGRQVFFSPWSILGHPVLLFGKQVIVFKASYLPAYPGVLFLLIGFGIANTLFWNRPLLLALGLPDYPLKVSVWGAIAKLGLTLVFVPLFGYLGAATLLSGYLAITVGLNVWKGMEQIRRMRSLELVGVAE